MTIPLNHLRQSSPLAERGRRQRKAEETRLRIFRAAMQLFAEQGMGQVTVEQITQAADVGKGTFFNYFQSKEHVLVVLAEIQLAKMREALEQAADGSRPAQQILYQLMKRIAEEPGKTPEMARTILGSFLASAEVREMIAGFLKLGRREIERIIVYGQQRGEIDASISARNLAFMLQRTLFGTLLLWAVDGKTLLASCIDDGFQQFWRAAAACGKGGRQ